MLFWLFILSYPIGWTIAYIIYEFYIKHLDPYENGNAFLALPFGIFVMVPPVGIILAILSAIPFLWFWMCKKVFIYLGLVKNKG